jgi:hypothetical protein
LSDQGVFQVHRGIFDHPIFAPEPFTEREAWMWMLSTAAWAPKRVRVTKGLFDLKRGQLAFALDFMAKKFQWSKSKVGRFLKRLKTDTMIETLATRDATLITICNYDQYQFGRNASETPIEPQIETPAERERHEEEELKHINTGRKKETREAALSSDFEFEDFWEIWPNKVGKPAALRAFVSARKRAGLDAIVAGVFAYIRDKPPDRPWLNPATFLNQNRWEDQPAQVANGKSQDNPRGGSLIAAIDRRLAAIAVEGESDPQMPADHLLRIPHRPVQ